MAESANSHSIKRFFKDAATYAVSGMATTFIGVVMVPIYTRVFTPSEYGALDLINTLLAFLILFGMMGQPSAVGRFYVDAESDLDRRLYASTSGVFVFLLAAVVAAIGLLARGPVADFLLGTRVYGPALVVAMMTFPFTVLFRFLQNMLKWRQEPLRYLLVSVGAMVLGLGLTIYLVVVAGMGVTGVFLAMLVNSVVFSSVAFIAGRTSFAAGFSRSRLSDLLKFGAPLIPVGIAYYLLTYSNRYFLRYFEGLETVGLYAIGVRVSAVLALMLNGFQMAIGPFVYSHYKEPDAPQTFAKTFDYVSVATTLAVTTLALFASDIVAVFATPTYMPAHVVVPLLAAGTAMYGLGAYFSFGIGIAKKTIHRAWTGALAAGVNVLLNVVLVPRWGMMGAACATAFSFALLAWIQMRLSQKYYRVPYRFGRNFAMYGAAAAVIAVAYGTGLHAHGLALAPVKLALVAAVGASAALAGLLTAKELRYAKSLVSGALGRGGGRRGR